VKSKISAETAGMSDEIRPIEPEDASGQIKELVDVTDEAPNSPNLDQPTGTSFQPPPDPGLSALEELLKASETDFSLDKDQSAIGLALDPTGAIFSERLKVPNNPEWLEDETLAFSGLVAIPTPEEVAAIENGDRIPTIGGSLGVEDFISQGSGTSVMELPANIGPQPNGDYGVVVIVPEQMVSLVLGQAEMDGVSPSEWLSVRVGEYLETWAYGR